MLLKALVEFAKEQSDLPPAMYIRTPIRWLIDIDENGALNGFTRMSDGGDAKVDRGKRIFAPHAMRASGIRPKLLADNGEYVLGIGRKSSKQSHVEKCHRAFVEEVRRCAEKTGDKSVRAVLTFLEGWGRMRGSVPEDLSPEDALTFRVSGDLPINSAVVKSHWADVAGKGRSRMQCLVCGRIAVVSERLQFKVKGIPGGQKAGATLLSANELAFESYGLKHSLTAPTCNSCGEAFSKALIKLIEVEAHRIVVGPVLYIFWTKSGDFSPAPYLRDSDPTEVRALFKAPFGGHTGAVNLDEAPLYAAALTTSNARVAVRGWIETTVAAAKEHLRRYFELQRIAEPDGSEWRALTLFALAVSTVREAKDLPERTVRHLLDAALNGGFLPLDLLFQAVHRNRAEQQVTRSRAALIKMVLLSQDPNWKGGDEMVDLNLAECSPAYLCGRLLAVLENLQHAAIPGVEAGVVERFYGAASATPATVFPTLVRKAQAHLSKLRTTSAPVYNALQRRIEEITDGLPDFPQTLTLKEQGRFCLGYYHQRSNDRSQARERKEAKAAAAEQ